MGQIADNRAQSLGITIPTILDAKLKTPAKNSETLRQIADNSAQALAITIRSILEGNLTTTRKQQRNFETTSRQQGRNPRYHHS